MFSYYVFICALITTAHANYWAERDSFMKEEREQYVGADIVLSKKEQLANEVLMKLKKKELDCYFNSPESFPPAMHFFKAKQQIEKSPVFAILQQMPKGAALHTHDTAMMNPDWVLEKVTYRDHLYACLEGCTKILLKFAKEAPSGWKSLSEIRKGARNKKSFDAWLRKKFTLVIDNPEEVYTDVNTVWTYFMKIFNTITPLLTYRPVFEDYLYAVIQKFHDDNVLYIEMRTTVPPLYDLERTYNGTEVIDIIQQVVEKFIKDHPESMGLKLIYGPPRRVSNATMDGYLQLFKTLQDHYSHFVVGFDLVGQEDLGVPLVDFVSKLMDIQAGSKYFFHAGETNWNGMPTDLNLIDAVLFNTSRIGHGYAIVKHPKVFEEVKKRGIAIEVNPISNQVLLLVKDIRNHPASIMLAQNYPIVISCDDPGFWAAEGLSYDFYVTFMGIAEYEADLKVLKQLALNSLTYSALTEEEKERAMRLWKNKWDLFIDNVIEQYSKTETYFPGISVNKV